MLLKLIVDRKTDRVLGCHVLGADAAEMVQMTAIAMRMGATKADFDATRALHPLRSRRIRHHAGALATARHNASCGINMNRFRRPQCPDHWCSERDWPRHRLRFAQEGASVWLTDINRDAAEATASELNDAGGNCTAHGLDVH